MARLIDAEQFDVVCDANKNREERSDDFIAGVLWMLTRIDEAPSINPDDVFRVKYGKWIRKKYNVNYPYYRVECSLCGGRPLEHWGKEFLSDYCPHCGAKLEDGTLL